MPWWRAAAAQLVHFFAVMLWVAAALAIIAGLAALGAAIVLVILANATFAFVQEYRAELAALQLRDLLPRRVLVVRDGRLDEIAAEALVVGDRVRLGPGDRIPADVVFASAHAALVDTSTLTGESVPVPVDDGDVASAGTFLVGGEADVTVVATGGRTRLAEIAALTRATTRPPTPLAMELRRLVHTIASIALGVGLGFFGLAVLLGTPWAEGIVFAIGVAVALVPEALLPTVTLSLAVGAQRMAGRHALVRRLEAVETLGSTTFICTDKTGTLTRNEMTVVEVWTPAGRATIRGAGYGPEADIALDVPSAAGAVAEVALDAARCASGRAVEHGGTWVARGDPMDAACWALAARVGADASRDRRPEVARFPFDPSRRRLSVVIGDRLVTKGAPDAIMALAAPAPGSREALDDMTRRGLRVLAIASRTVASPPSDARDAERDLELGGLLGFEDPPRPEVADAIAACRRAGIKVGMVTGDHPATALAVAREVGLTDADRALTGDELPEDEQLLGALLDRDGVVVARIDPEQKLTIARALQARGHVVAMTGDGVNDGPALQEADIGVAMGRTGTDVAREAADLVLLDDDFATIVAAVELGRAAFANTRRFLTYHLTDNVAELTPFLVWALSGGRIPLALTVMQILALDLGTDTLSATALGAERPTRRALEGPPVRGRLLDRVVAIRAFGVLGPVEAVFEMTAFFATFVAAGWRPGDPFPSGVTLAAASGAAFATVVLAQTANAWACRSVSHPAWWLPFASNRLLLAGASIELAIAAFLLWTPALADVLRHSAPGAAGWAVAVVGAVAVLVADAGWKRWRPARRARADQRWEPARSPWTK